MEGTPGWTRSASGRPPGWRVPGCAREPRCRFPRAEGESGCDRAPLLSLPGVWAERCRACCSRHRRRSTHLQAGGHVSALRAEWLWCVPPTPLVFAHKDWELEKCPDKPERSPSARERPWCLPRLHPWPAVRRVSLGSSSASAVCLLPIRERGRVLFAAKAHGRFPYSVLLS